MSSTNPANIKISGDFPRLRPDTATGMQPGHMLGAPISIPIFQSGGFSEEDFLAVWKHNTLVVVRGIDRSLQGAWTPAFLINKFGRETVKPIHCGTDLDAEGKWTLADFLATFEGGEGGNALKLKDWPPQDLFRQKFPDYYDSFIQAIPIPTRDVAALDGVKNLAAHFDRHGCPPDLGPKMYVAYGSPGSQNGTTKLHLDFTDAVNLMTYCPDPKQAGAIWHASPPESQPHIRQYLRTVYPTQYAEMDPIHSQDVYLTDAMWEDLRSQCNVQFVQNRQNAIKIACDFVSLHNLDVTASMVPQQRAHRLNSAHGEDLLQLNTLVWHAWRSLSTFPASAITTEERPFGVGMCSTFLSPSIG
ncbi:uncharacterized protein BXZ73DRAFT_101993 [Epithele typhae]|uniref:uncharacterized protein n=1 Tax=Epithele typhae TaxID=378194 RepID=UPI0020076027|nr:uncharacterized protein BXZ73DRAFT_101993 [Epithele typhae]KAH9929931.1 hypothetical protein BXZ73DRAFT_101993 [Epithele typhae]